MKALLGLVLLTLPLVATAETVAPVESVETFVNIRLNPQSGTEIVGRLHRGDALVFIRTVDGWHEVELPGGGTGFIHADWAVVVPDEPEMPEPVEEAPEPVEEAPEELEEAVVEAALEAPEEDGENVVELKGTKNFLVRFRDVAEGGNSQIFDDGNFVGIGTTEPKQRLEVNGSIQIHEQNSSVAGLMITQSSGDTGYILHNRASTLTIGAGSIDRITIDRNGNVGFGVERPSHPIEMGSGAHVTAGGVWTNSSSRDRKKDIAELSVEEAVQALANLQPVQFRYRNDDPELYVGFIAEDVPDLVAMDDRQSLSAMDVVAVLTKVVQAQQQRIAALEERLDEM